MLLKYFYDDALAQASYLVGCAKTGEALVIDPMRNIAPYRQMAAQHGLRITHVAETHIHADFVSGLRELAAATGATQFVSGMGSADYAFAGESNVMTVSDGDSWMVGNIRVDVMHTPGHTPEHISFMITDTAGANAPIGIFTGDFVFAGDVGRPDLLEAVLGAAGSAASGARQQFESVQRLKQLQDYLQLWPGHGAGSACGKALGAIPSTTLGYERRFNPAFQYDDAGKFSNWLLGGQPEAPAYFAQMKRMNKSGPPILRGRAMPALVSPAHIATLLNQGAQVLDLRDRDLFARGHLAGSISVPASAANYTTYLGWLIDYVSPVWFILPDATQRDAVTAALHAIGVDDVRGMCGPELGGEATRELPGIDSQTLAAQLGTGHPLVVDVRNCSEYDALHIVGARHIPLGHLRRHLAELPRDRTLVLQCASGYRSHIAASLLVQAGYANAVSLRDDMAQWSRHLPVEGPA